VIVLALAAAAPTWIDVEVYVDRDGDGRREPGEDAVPGAVVGAGVVEAVCDGRGRARLEAAPGTPVWVRGFDGFAVPGPWAPAPAGGGVVALGLRPRAAPAGPWRFVVAADAHIRADDEAAAEDALPPIVDQMTAGADPPRFVALAGDLTQHASEAEARVVERAFQASPAPLVPVVGNHDWYDRGAAFRRVFGPDLYSIALGGVHVVVLDSMRPIHEVVAFARADLATADPGARVIAILHAPPPRELAVALGALGVEVVLAGHWHANRVVHASGVTELDTEPLIMAGIDQTPAGYRVIEVEPGAWGGRATLRVRHYPSVEARVVALVGPAPGQCAPPGRAVDVIAAVGGGPDLTPVSASADGGAPVALDWIGGWDWAGRLPALAAGRHTITLDAGGVVATAALRVCAPPAFAPPSGAWPQLGGGPGRRGDAGHPLPARLRPRWVHATGGHLIAGSPVIAGGVVVVATADLADDQRSAVVALDLATGAERWRFAPGAAVRNAVAAADGVVVAAADDGVVWGLDLGSGRVRWRTDLGAGVRPEHATTWMAPLVAGDTAWVGNQRRFAALEVATGRIRWQVDPVPDADKAATMSSPTLAGGRVLAIPNRIRSGLMAWDARTGAEAWQDFDVCSVSPGASPVAVGPYAYVVSGATERCAVEVATGDIGTFGQLDPGGFAWAYEVAATPAAAGGALVAVTTRGRAYAFDTHAERLRWSRAVGEPAPIHAAHYRARTASLAGSPVIAGPWVWMGTADGRVVALDLADGRERAALAVGAPVLSGLAVAGDTLVVASVDGTVRAFSPAARRHGWVHVAVDAVVVGGLFAVLLGLVRRRSRLRARALDRRRRIGRRPARSLPPRPGADRS
jgi:outer membrane protein assembly factor BamB